MGLDYSIRTYVKTEKLPNSLGWLYKNTWTGDSTPLVVNFDNNTLRINGDSFKKSGENLYLNKDIPISEFEGLDFSTSLIFDIDPKIIASEARWELQYDMDLIKDFIEHFEACYLGNGKIRIGGFDSSIAKLKGQEVYRLDFTAVTSDMSRMLEESISVRKWILELSEYSESLITYIDMKSDGHKVLYYKGQKVEIVIRDPSDMGSKSLFNDFFKNYFDFFEEYFQLELDE